MVIKDLWENAFDIFLYLWNFIRTLRLYLFLTYRYYEQL